VPAFDAIRSPALDDQSVGKFLDSNTDRRETARNAGDAIAFP